MRPLAAALVVATVGVAGAGLSSGGCVSIDPGPNYVVPAESFNADYFYCFVEPNLIFGKKCGDDGSGGCHYSDKVPAMELTDHVPVTCANGHPTDPTQIGTGSAAANNFGSVSTQMLTDWMSAPIYIEPTQIAPSHPKQVFTPSDPVVKYISTWATE